MILASFVSFIFQPAVGVLLAKALDAANAEAALANALPAALLTKDALLAVAALALWALNNFAAFYVAGMRARFAVKQPVTHAEEKDFKNKEDRLPWLRAVRSQENIVENASALFGLVLAAVTVVPKPATILALVLAVFVARILYVLTYANGVSRALPFMTTMFATAALAGNVILVVAAKAGVDIPLPF